jgi:hypothetical protein
MDAYLKKHGTAVAAHTVKVNWSIAARELRAAFTVQKRTGKPWLSDPVFTDDWAKNWGLWNNDVVEAFLQLRARPDDLRAPYLEVQVSPRNQPFALVVTEPEELTGTLLYGGFFACLDADPREFFALAPNPEPAPDFHRPDLFLPLAPHE